MTNKEFRSDLAKEMRDKYDERNGELERIEKSSYSEGLKEQMSKEIKDNFMKDMEEMKSRPGYEEARKTHLEEIKAKIKLAKSKQEKERLQKEYEERLAKVDEDIADSEKGYKEAQIAHRGKVEQLAENEIPQELKDFREKWEKEIDLPEETKERIIKAVNKIPHRASIESDGSRLVEFELGGKNYKCLDVNLAEHSDSEYFTSYEYKWQTNYEVRLGGMRGDDTSKRENKKLAEYVDKEKDKRGMEIRTIEFQRDLIDKLGNEAGLTEMRDKIAMWMYLTGNYGYFWLSMGDREKSGSQDSRSGLGCDEDDRYRYFNCNDDDDYSASLCMIACK